MFDWKCAHFSMDTSGLMDALYMSASQYGFRMFLEFKCFVQIVIVSWLASWNVVSLCSLLLSDCEISCEQMTKKRGYDRLFGIISGVGPPDMNTLHSVLSMSTFGVDPANEGSRFLRNAKPIQYLLKWICETEYENDDQQVMFWIDVLGYIQLSALLRI